MKRKIRQLRTKRKIIASKTTRTRVSIFRSNRHTYISAIEDSNGKTLVTFSDLNSQDPGADLGKFLLNKKIKRIVFDRSGYKFHGQIKKIADKLRESGLEF